MVIILQSFFLIHQLQKEILEVYNQLRKLCAKIRSQPSHRRSSSSVTTDNAGGDEHQQTCNSFDDLRPGQLTSVLQELQQLVHTQLYPSKYKVSGFCFSLYLSILEIMPHLFST